MERVVQREACRDRHCEQSVGLNEPALCFLRKLNVQEIALSETEGKVVDC